MLALNLALDLFLIMNTRSTSSSASSKSGDASPPTSSDGSAVPSASASADVTSVLSHLLALQQQSSLDSQALATALQHLASSSQPPSVPPPIPKLSPLSDTDDPEHWFGMVETVLSGHRIDQSRHALAIAPYLTGKALAAFHSLPPSEASDFAKVRAAVLGRFQVDAESYRRRFRTYVHTPEETWSEAAQHLDSLLGKWLEHAKATRLPALRDLLVLEQLVSCLPPPAKQHVVQHSPTSAAQAAQLADAYQRSQDVSYHAPFGGEEGIVGAVDTSTSGSCQYCGGRNHPRRDCPASDRICDKCGKRGHFKKVCKARESASVNVVSAGRPQENTSLPPVKQTPFLG